MQAVPPATSMVNIIPAGFKWSADAARKAQEGRYFIRVGGLKTTNRYLSGASRGWQGTNPDEQRAVFLLGARLTGTPEDVAQALRYAGVDEKEIQDAVADAVTRDNYATTKAAYVQQENAAKDEIKKGKDQGPRYDLSNVLWFGANLGKAYVQTKGGETRQNAGRSPGRAKGGQSLADRLKGLPEGKVLDVSNMDLATGKGIRTVGRPKSEKSGKVGTQELPIISSDVNRYRHVLQQLGGENWQTLYGASYARVEEDLRKLATKGTATTAPVFAPPRVPSPVHTAVAQPPVATIGGAGFPAIPPANAALQGLFAKP